MAAHTIAPPIDWICLMYVFLSILILGCGSSSFLFSQCSCQFSECRFFVQKPQAVLITECSVGGLWLWFLFLGNLCEEWVGNCVLEMNWDFWANQCDKGFLRFIIQTFNVSIEILTHVSECRRATLNHRVLPGLGVVYTFNPSTFEVEAEDWDRVILSYIGQPGVHEPLSEETKKARTKTKQTASPF